jgi:hypothetical protein
MPTNPFEPPMMGKRLTISLAVFALIVVPLAIYVVGYLCLGQRNNFYRLPTTNGDTFHVKQLPGSSLILVERRYPSTWHAAAFKPLGSVEQWVRKVDVDVLGESVPPP